MTTKIAHISDIHWRSLKRHDEYRTVFEKLFNILEQEKPDLIFIGGDIVHSKTQGITPEIIDVLNWWFTSLCEIAPTHVILGNHDGLLLNKDRQDAISPIVNALNNPRLFLYKKSGVYPSGVKNINWCVFSCFDEENWSKVKPIKNNINIACFHGAVWGSKTDVDWELEGEVGLSFFENYDFTFLGDIHKYQFLDKEKRIAYPGSTIQQNYGEDIKKGFLLWTINNSHDYSSKFISISNPFPYITIDWQGNIEKTFKYCEKVKKESRFRIRSKTQISQAEIKLLHYYLKNDKSAKEIIFQNLSNSENSFATNNNNFKCIRNSKDRKLIIDEFFADLDKEKVEKIHQLFKENLDKLPNKSLDSIGNKWTINNINFNNTFSYGKDNFINFDNLSGIVGLFGNNRSGKSSIPGTLMYSLFNGTDRGSLKNIDIVNTRKGFCDSSIEFTVNSNKYKLYRKTEKKTNKKGITSASTDLSLTKIGSDYSQNESEEQRRETEKIVKSLIGTQEDFLVTSFASQGEINSFIKEKSSSRKSILSKFLNIDLYDELCKLSREEYIVLKNKIKDIKEKNWDSEIENLSKDINKNNNEIIELQEKISLLRDKEIKLNISKQNLIKENTDESGYTIDDLDKEIKFINLKVKDLQEKNGNSKKNIDLNNKKLDKIKNFKNDYSLESLREENEKLNVLLKKLNNYKSQRTILNTEFARHENQLKILDQVPCNDEYSHCKFIKKAHESKKEINEVNNNLKEIEGSVYEIQGVIKNLENQKITEKIKKFNEVLLKEEKIKSELSHNNIVINHNQEKIETFNEKLNNLLNIRKTLELKINKNSVNELNDIINDLEITTKNIKNNENKINLLQQKNYINQNNIDSLLKEKIDFLEIAEKWKIFDLYSFSISKKGIPTSIINSSLPIINNEISKILNEVVNFKILLEENSNSLEVYIDYGDSKRIIECASGMEKMIASIAIRVALINISNLPKSDIFIIDEGFGALDDNNIEACGRLLSSLKKHFKTILIISHVDAIKDIVDKNLEIAIKNKDSYVRFE